MTFTQAADSRVAGHLADGRGLVGEQQCLRAEAGGSRRSLAARMAAPDDDDVVTHGGGE